MKTKYVSTTNPGGLGTSPHRVVLRYDEHKKEWVTHIENLNLKSFDHGNYFSVRVSNTPENIGKFVTPSAIEEAYKLAEADYRARCAKYDVLPCIIERMEVQTAFKYFIVMALGYWGKGKTIAEAIESLAKHSGWGKREMAKQKLIAFWGTEDIEVLSNGYVSGMNFVDLGVIQAPTK